MTMICSYHPEADLIEDYRAGDMICTECGLVVADRIIDVSTEWRTFTDTDLVATDMNRVGSIQDLNNEDLSTKISQTSDQPIRALNTQNKDDKLNKKINQEIKEISDRLSADQSIISNAQNVYYSIKDKLKSHRNRTGIISACLLIAFRQQSAPRSIKEICGAADISSKILSRYLKIVSTELNSKLGMNKNITFSSDDFIARYCSKLGYSFETRKTALQIMKDSKEIIELSGKNPNTIAAASIFLASVNESNKRSLTDIAHICNLTASTIEKTFKIMLKYPKLK